MKKLTKAAVLMLILALLCSSTMLPSFAQETKNAVVSIELAGERNVEGDPSPKDVGWAGTAVTIGDRDIVVIAVGRMFFTGANISHSFLVVNAEDGSLVNTSSIAVQGYDDSVDGTFEYYYFEAYEYLTLLAGHTYYFCSDFYGPLDRHYDSCKVTSSPDLSFTGTVDLKLDDGSWIFTEAPGINNLPVDFIYYVAAEGEETEPAPTENTDSAEPSASAPAASSPSAEPVQKPSSDLGLWVVIGIAVAALAAVCVVIVAGKRKR